MNDFTLHADAYHTTVLNIWDDHSSHKHQQHWPACMLRVVDLDDDASKNVENIEKLFPSECFSLFNSDSESLLTPFEYKPGFSYWSSNDDDDENEKEDDLDEDDELESIDSETTLEGLKLIPLLEDATLSVTSEDDTSLVSSDDEIVPWHHQSFENDVKPFDPVIAPPKKH